MRITRSVKYLAVVSVLALVFTAIMLYTARNRKFHYLRNQIFQTVSLDVSSATHLNEHDNQLTPANQTSISVFSNLEIDKGQNWPNNSFCDEFLSHKFKVDVSPCKESTKRIECFSSPYDDKMGSCTLTDLAIDMPAYYDLMKRNRDSIVGSNTLWLNREHDGLNPCAHSDFSGMERTMVGGDWVKKMAKAASLTVPKGDCQEWIEGTTIFYFGFDVHIYFKFLSWFSLHNGVSNLESKDIFPTNIIRVPEREETFLFPDVESRLFPETNVYSLEEFSEKKKGIVCFRRAIAVPWAYSSTPFRCKMADSAYRIRSKCYDCNSRGLPGTRFQSFRRRVLNACSLKDSPQSETESKTKTIVVQLRKQYRRWKGDQPHSFLRVLKNPDALIAALRQNFPSANVLPVYPEELPLCEQVRIAHETDILLGVHGAGLVHLWWMQDKSLLFELVPHSQLANPTFKMLSALTGKKYYGFSRVSGSEKEVIVNTDLVVNELKKLLS